MESVTPESIRAVIAKTAEQQQRSLADLSKKIGRNHAYLQQFIKRGIPQFLPIKTARDLAGQLGIDPALLSPDVAPRKPAAAGDKINVTRRTADYSMGLASDGSLVLTISAKSNLHGEFDKLLVQYAAASPAARKAAMMRLSLPDQPGDPDTDWIAGVKAGLLLRGVIPDSPDWFRSIAKAIDDRATQKAGLLKVDNSGAAKSGIAANRRSRG